MTSPTNPPNPGANLGGAGGVGCPMRPVLELHLTGQTTPDIQAALGAHLPTCAVAEFAFDVDSWSRVGQVGPVRATLVSPKSA